MLPGTSTHRPVTVQPPRPHLTSLPPPNATPVPDADRARPVEPRRVEHLFRPIITTDAARRIRARSAWTIASSGLQGVAVALLATVSTQWVERERPVIVPVKIVRTAEPPAPPAPPPAAAPAKAPMPPPPRSPPAKRVVTPLVQPRVVPTELKKPDPNEPPEEVWYGDGEGGVVGGVVGVVAAAPATVAVAVAPTPPPAPEKPVRYRAEMTPPAFVAGPPLEYTQAAIERDIEGTMVVECVVDVSGAVHACRVVKGLPFLDRAAVANLEQRRYRPATLDGKALSVTYTFTLNFKLP